MTITLSVVVFWLVVLCFISGFQSARIDKVRQQVIEANKIEQRLTKLIESNNSQIIDLRNQVSEDLDSATHELLSLSRRLYSLTERIEVVNSCFMEANSNISAQLNSKDTLWYEQLTALSVRLTTQIGNVTDNVDNEIERIRQTLMHTESRFRTLEEKNN